MNSFNRTDGAVFPCRLCFLEALPFISLIEENNVDRSSIRAPRQRKYT